MLFDQLDKFNQIFTQLEFSFDKIGFAQRNETHTLVCVCFTTLDELIFVMHENIIANH